MDQPTRPQPDNRIRRSAAALAATRAAYGPERPETLQARRRLAHAYRAAGRFEAAARHFEAAAEGSASWHGRNHPETLRYRSSLANCHYAAGDMETAIAMFRELVAARQQALGAHHPDTMRSRGSLGNALRAAGRLDEAVPPTGATPATGPRPWGLSTRPRRPAGATWNGRLRNGKRPAMSSASYRRRRVW